MLTLFPANSINLCCGGIDGRRIEQLRPKPNGAIIGEMKDFIHPRLDEPVVAIGGRYVFTAEGQLPVDGRVLLYLAGWAVADNVTGRRVELQGVAGTAVFKVLGLQVARTGLSAKEAEKEGFGLPQGAAFIALLVDTDAEGARMLAERMRARIEELVTRKSRVCVRS